MSINVIPQWDGVEIHRENDMIRAATMRYNVIGVRDPVVADHLLTQFSDPVIFGNLYRTASSIERVSTRGYEGVVEYEYRNLDEYTFAFDTTGGTQHVTQSYRTVGRYAPEGKTPPNHHGTIGVNDGNIAGCDVIVPTLSFSMSRTKTGILDIEFIKFLSRMTGRINSFPFLTFAPGEVLFEGASGSQKFTESDNPQFDLTYKFRVSPNEENLIVGQEGEEENESSENGVITVGYKRGWDYFWVQYTETEDEEANVISKQPIAAFVERVYKNDDLNLLLS